jgi:Leucine-rich repeat (LRR) protein
MAKKYYCGLCETSHNALKSRHQCNLCARFYCDSALADARTVGVTTCVFCDGDLTPFFFTTKLQNLTEDQIAVVSDEISKDSTNFLDSQTIQENFDLPSELDLAISYSIEIEENDLDKIRLMQEIMDRKIPLLENEDDFQRKFGIIVRNHRIIGLSLFKQEIRRVPVVIRELDQLEKLNMRENRIEQLPDMRSLKLLQELDLSYNQLKELPTTLGDIPSLTTLFLNNNQLKKIPISLTNLQLKKLNLQNNPCWIHQPRSRKLQRWIDNLTINGCEIFEDPQENKYRNITLSPREVEFLEEIERLVNRGIPHSEAAGNIGSLEQLKKISFGFYSMQERIIVLGLVNLHLSTLPRSIQSLSAVEMMNLSHNRFTQLPRELYSLVTLRGLNLENNILDTIDSGIKNLKELKALDLQKNKLRRVPKSLGALSNLEILILKENDLISLPSSLKDLESLKIIDLRGNPIWNEREERRELQKWFKKLKKQQCKILGL